MLLALLIFAFVALFLAKVLGLLVISWTLTFFPLLVILGFIVALIAVVIVIAIIVAAFN